MADSLDALHQGLARRLDEERKHRDSLWQSYWEGRRMVTVPENYTDDVAITGNTFTNTGGRLFPSFPNLAPKNDPLKPHRFAATGNGLCAVCGCAYDTVCTGDGPSYQLHPSSLFGGEIVVRNNVMVDEWRRVIRDCIARLKAARDKDSTNRNLSTLLAVVVKVQKDLESLVGESLEREAPAPRSNETGVAGNDWQREDAHRESQVTRDDRSL